MAKKDTKVPIGSRLGKEHKQTVAKLTNELNTKKYIIYEASIDIFAALHPILQMSLISNNKELRESVLNAIKQLTPSELSMKNKRH